MKRLIILYSVVLVLSLSVAVYAENIPVGGSNTPQTAVSQQVGSQQQFYGYVPPPPIRHTWPGGYKVIFHEMMNTLMEHIIGHY
ncbi:MAG: hypothetical protein WC647_17640 [Desulfomonilaceae bacterium]